MSKTNKIYKIFMTTMIVAIAGMLLAMGIIAAQRTMKVNVAFPANPYYKIEIWIQKNGDEEKLAFCNFEDKDLDKEIVMQNGILSLDGNTIQADNSFFTKYENEFYIIIKNYTESTGIEVSMSSTGQVDENTAGIPAQFDPIKTTASKFDRNNPTDVDYIKYNVFANAVFPQQTTLQIEIQELNSFTVQFATGTSEDAEKYWVAKYDSQEITSISVLPNSDLTIVVEGAGEDRKEGYSVHNAPVVAESTSYNTTSFDRFTGEFTIYGIKGNLTISIADTEDNFRPWTYGRYGSNEIFEGYSFLKFANDPNTEWVIIGCGDNLTNNLFDSNLIQGFGGTEYTYTKNSVDYALIGPNPNPVDKTDSTNKNSNGKELADNQILLLRKQHLNEYFEFYTWDNSNAKEYLNVTWNALNDYKTYIVSPQLYTHKGGYLSGEVTLDDGDDTKIFLLGCRYGYVGSNMLPNIKGSFLTKTGYDKQNYLIEDYLGTYLGTDGRSNAKIFYDEINDYNGYYKLRSSFYVDDLGSYGVWYGNVGTMAPGITSSGGLRPSCILNLA